jgi:hypothetical protein
VTSANVFPLLILTLISLAANLVQFLLGGWLLRKLIETQRELDVRSGRCPKCGGKLGDLPIGSGGRRWCPRCER